jgi:hypothetical protein
MIPAMCVLLAVGRVFPLPLHRDDRRQHLKSLSSSMAFLRDIWRCVRPSG